MYLWNSSNHVQENIISQRTRPQSAPPILEPQFSDVIRIHSLNDSYRATEGCNLCVSSSALMSHIKKALKMNGRKGMGKIIIVTVFKPVIYNILNEDKYVGNENKYSRQVMASYSK